MKLKHLLILPVLTAVGCQQMQQGKYDSYDDYPVVKGDWEEMTYTPQSTRFALWAPTAEEVNVKLYDEGTGGEPVQVLPMKSAENGLWRTAVAQDLIGKFYTFDVKVNGNWLGDTPGVWAKAVGVNGDRAAVIDLNATDPEGWEQDKRPELKSFADIVLYEMLNFSFPFVGNSTEDLGRRILAGRIGPIRGGYSQEIVSIVKSLLQTNPDMRPSSKDLMEHPSIKSRLHLIHPVIVDDQEEDQHLLKTIKVPLNIKQVAFRLQDH